MSRYNCSVCGNPLGHIDEACPRCLPNFYSLRPKVKVKDKDAEIARLKAENERLEKRLAAAGNELDTLRKAVWFLEPYEIPLNRKGWFLDAGYADIEKLQKEMGK